MGILIDSWPLTPGTDAAGIVVKAGKNAISPLGKPFKEGDRVFGCTRLGTAKYQAFQEYVCTFVFNWMHQKAYEFRISWMPSLLFQYPTMSH